MIHGLINNPPAILHLGNIGSNHQNVRRPTISCRLRHLLETSLSSRSKNQARPSLSILISKTLQKNNNSQIKKTNPTSDHCSINELPNCTYFTDPGGGAGDHNNLAGDIFTEQSAQNREEELEELERRQEEEKGEEGERRS